MNRTLSFGHRLLIAAACLSVAGPLSAARLVYEQTGQVEAVAPDAHDIKINGESYRLAKKVNVRSVDKPTESLAVESISAGTNVGYSLSNTGENQKPEIGSIWLLHTK